MNILKSNFKKFLVVPIYTLYILIFGLLLGIYFGNDPWEKLISWKNR
ncbi:hypothetical protein [Clostridium sp. CCUG 7971]|nr:hypothetical protein [Clostridium sp. CCUG 7971]MBO3443871.1 hypothetical protein [Clostridium sp. CCUG 7971]